MVRYRHLLLSSTLFLAGVGSTPRPAEACGGFFCSNTAPVDQSAERIIFVQVDESTVEAHVQITYTGPSDRFSWVVPTPSLPEVGVGSDYVFQILEGRTNPQQAVSYFEEGDCREEIWDDYPTSGADTGTVGDDTSHDAGSGVTVVGEGVVGAFNYQILMADSAERLTTWMESEGYDLPPNFQTAVAPYLVSGEMYFVAFRLTKGSSDGDIQPVTLRYNATAPMIPIQLTAVAAQPDMQILTWVLANDYAMPANYDVVEVSPLKLYAAGAFWSFDARRQLYSEAIDLAGGHAFVRERAESTETYSATFFTEAMFPESALRETTDPIDYWWLLRDVSWAVAGDPLFLAILQECIPMPASLVEEGLDAVSFYNNLDWYTEDLADFEFSPETCTNTIAERMMTPRMHAQELFDGLSHLSRFATYLDADEMTLDPGFCYDGAAADFDGQYEYTLTSHCVHPSLYAYEAPQSITYGDTQIWFGRGWESGTATDLSTLLSDVSVLERSYRSDCSGGSADTTPDADPGAESVEDVVSETNTWFEDEWVAYEPPPNWDDPPNDPNNPNDGFDAGGTTGPSDTGFGGVNPPGDNPGNGSTNDGNGEAGDDESGLVCSTTGGAHPWGVGLLLVACAFWGLRRRRTATPTSPV